VRENDLQAPNYDYGDREEKEKDCSTQRVTAEAFGSGSCLFGTTLLQCDVSETGMFKQEKDIVLK
jgi:hypothetical protein